MKSLQAPNLKTIGLTKAMYTIRNCDEHAFNMSIRNRSGLFQVRAWLRRPKNMAASDPSEVTQETP